jgi:hypothetical protein
MATKKKSTKATKKKSSAGKKGKQTLLAEYSPQFEKVRNLLLVGLGVMGVIVDIIFKTWNEEIGKNAKHSNLPMVANWQENPEIQGKYAEVCATFGEAEYRFPGYCFGTNTRGDVRRMKAIMEQIDPPLIVMSIDNIFSSAKFGEIEGLLFAVLDIAKQLRRDAKVPICIASPTVQLPAEFNAWADAIFDCDVVGDSGRFQITDITDYVK